jgi:hypothetical protein
MRTSTNAKEGHMKRIGLSLLVAGALIFGTAGSASGASNAQGCPGDGTSAQANAGMRAELVAEAKAGLAAGENFGRSVQSAYNHEVCGHGKPN